MGELLMRILGTALFLFGALVPSANARSISGTPPFKKVMIVIFENMDYGEVMKQPFFSGFAKGGANLAQFHAEVHPSQANYIALTSGSLHGVPGDNDIDLDVRHVGNLIEEHGLNW